MADATTGKYATREELVEAVQEYMKPDEKGRTLSWDSIAYLTGVCNHTVRRIGKGFPCAKREPGANLTTGRFPTRERLEEAVIHGRKAGFTLDRIAQRAGTSQRTVSKILAKHKLNTKKNGSI